MSPEHVGLLGILLVVLIAMLEVGIIESAYQRLGMSHRAVTLLLLLSIFGSYINIPIATILGPRGTASQRLQSELCAGAGE